MPRKRVGNRPGHRERVERARMILAAYEAAAMQLEELAEVVRSLPAETVEAQTCQGLALDHVRHAVVWLRSVRVTESE